MRSGREEKEKPLSSRGSYGQKYRQQQMGWLTWDFCLQLLGGWSENPPVAFTGS